MTEKKYKLDIFETLNAIDKKDRTYLSRQSEDVAKAFAPSVVARWLTGTHDKRQLYFLNEFVNPFLFSLGKHPELLYQLMCVTTNGPKRYYWQALKGKQVKRKLAASVVAKYYNFSIREANQSLHLLDDTEILRMAEEVGYQKDELAALKKELK